MRKEPATTMFWATILAVIIFAMTMLVSCSTQHHSTSTEQKTSTTKAVVKDSANYSHTDTSRTVKNETATKTVKDSSNTVTVKTKDSTNVQVTFNGGATDKPIRIKDSAGQTIIDPGGRNVTGVNVSKSKEKKHKQQKTDQTSDSTGAKKTDKQLAVNDNASQTKAKDVAKQVIDNKAASTDNKSSVSFLARFGLYFIALIVIVAVWLVVKYWSKIMLWWTNIFKR